MENSVPSPRNSRPLSYSHRRSSFCNYKERGIYLFTFCVEGRKPLLGTLQGSSAEKAFVQPSSLGEEVIRLLLGIPKFQRQKAEEINHLKGCDIRREIDILAYQLMPDHLHVILFVKREMDISIGEVLRGFMIACTKACFFLGIAESSTRKKPLWERGYHDRKLTAKNQLQSMMEYVHDNPRRLFLKHQNTDLFTIKHAVMKAGYEFDAIGNIHLLDKPLHAVHVRSRFSPDARKEYMNNCILEARGGKILVGAFISEYEKQVRAVASPDKVKPSAYMPRAQQNPYWQTQRRISRAECVTLNTIAETIAN